MKIFIFNPMFIDTVAIARRNKQITFPSTNTTTSTNNPSKSTTKPHPTPSTTLSYTTTSTGELLPLPYDFTIPWGEWLLLFDTAAAINNWSDTATLSQMLVLSLRGQALAICQTLPESTRQDYKVLRGVLAEVLQPEEPLEVLMQQLQQRRRQPQETLRYLQVDVNRMVRHVYEGMENEELERYAKVVFLRCIEGSAYGVKTVEAQPKTLDEALMMAEFFERRELEIGSA